LSSEQWLKKFLTQRRRARRGKRKNLTTLESQGIKSKQTANMPAETNFYFAFFAPLREKLQENPCRRHRRDWGKESIGKFGFPKAMKSGII
jgi:hypothetical protein